MNHAKGQWATRRRFLAVSAAVPWFAGCASPLPLTDPPASGARGSADHLLLESAQAHGLAAFQSINDINVRYEGEWRPFIDRVQPVLVDKPHRGSSEERLLPKVGIVAQAYTGSAGPKQVVWRRATGSDGDRTDVAVWFSGRQSADPQALNAAALVADAYGLFLLGPVWLASRSHTSRPAGSERVDGRSCDVIDVWLRPGLGRTALDRLTLCIDSAGLMRRVRFTLEGFDGTRGAVAQVDTFDHERRFGVTWPMRSYEEVVHPLRMPAHDWRITGLDVDRGYGAAEVTGPAFGGAAAKPAAPL